MNEAVLRVRPRALAEYLRHRYAVQPGQGLCLVLGHPDAGDNGQALTAWVRDAVERHGGLGLCDQVQTIEHELCGLMVDAGIVDEAALGCAVPAGVVARIFGRTPINNSALAPTPSTRSRVDADNVIPFRGGPSHG